MLNLFGSLKGLAKLDSVCIDNGVFRLHYKVTVIILIAFSFLVTSKQYFGDPISCLAEGVPEHIMDSFCWIQSTFTLPNTKRHIIGTDVVQPGVSTPDEQDEVRYHKYYQWVCLVLFFQAILFYVPRYLWKTWEGGRIKILVQDLNGPLVSEDVKADRKKVLVDYIESNLNAHNSYAVRFFICEVLNFINVVGQMYFTNYFLGGMFITYGFDVIKVTEIESEDREDPMSLVFPKLTKCIFHRYGPSGTVQKLDGLCILSLNVVNEKIYVFLWFWFLFLSVVSGIALLYRAAVIAFPQLRKYLIRFGSSTVPHYQIEAIARKCKIGDWFVLHQLGCNIHPTVYREVLAETAGRLSGGEAVTSV